MSYRVERLDPATTFDPGTSVLVSGPSIRVSQRLFDAVTPTDGQWTITITTNDGADVVVEKLLERGADRNRIAVIDCTTRETDVEDVPVRHLSSPGDLTGISLEFAKLLEEAVDCSAPIRVGFESVSTGLMYTEVRTMFRFLHVFTARIRSGDMLGVFAMDPGMHEEKAHNTIRTVFDCEVRVDDADATIHGAGFEQ
jgi:hypothetical protein